MSRVRPILPPADLVPFGPRINERPEPEIPVLEEQVLALGAAGVEVVEIRRLDDVDAIRFERRARIGVVELVTGRTASPLTAAEWIAHVQTSARGTECGPGSTEITRRVGAIGR